jgi:shikimate dehydrogenase
MTVPSGISGRTKIVGVWGHPVGHSRSPVMHNAALAALGLDWVYVPFDVDPVDVAEAVAGVRALGLIGINVTVPLKEAVLPFLDEIDPEARRIGSVNTICNREGRLCGYSTDGPGFLRAMAALGEHTERRRVCLLGAGGSARAVAFALAGRGAQIQIVNRTADRAEALAQEIDRHFPGAACVISLGENAAPFDLLVNTTSLGMTPHEDALPDLPLPGFRDLPFVYDLIYSPRETRLLRAAREAGCPTANGVGMLVQQGALSLSLWTGLPVEAIPVALMAAAVDEALGDD